MIGLQSGYLFTAQIKPLYFKKFKSVSFHFINSSVWLVYNSRLEANQMKPFKQSKRRKDGQYIFIGRFKTQ